MICPFCSGTGKAPQTDPRCQKCRGAGYTGLVTGGGITTRVSCDCPMGKELARIDQRIADENAWNLAQPAAPMPRTPETTSSRLAGIINGVHYKPEDEPDE